VRASPRTELLQTLISARRHDKWNDIITSAAGVVFLGTPFHGSKSQSNASLIANIASTMNCGGNGLLEKLESDSEALRQLVRDFCLTVNTATIPIFCFYEQRSAGTATVLQPENSFLAKHKV